MTPTLKGQRLLLRPLKITDAPAIQRQFPHWNIVKHLSTRIPWPYPADGAFQFLSNVVLPKMENGQMLGWAICLINHPNALIGVMTYDFSETKGLRRGFWLAEQYHGHGYMTDAAALMQDHLFDVLKLPVFYAMNATDNHASRRIKEKLGGRHLGTVSFEHLSGGAESEMWAIHRDEWLSIRTRLKY